MTIRGLMILPPMAVARFGSSETPLESYTLQADSTDDPLGYRRIVPAETLEIDRVSGSVARAYTPEKIRFRDGARIRPVAPFLELFAQLESGDLEPVTLKLLTDAGLSADDVQWKVDVGNLKAFRQTGDVKDKVLASTDWFSDHESKPLEGRCENFLPQKTLPFGFVRYIRPTDQYPEVRLRFTPAVGTVYGSDLYGYDSQTGKLSTTLNPVFAGDQSRILYNKTKGTWFGWRSNSPRTASNPNDIYEGAEDHVDDPNNGLGHSQGYFDDVCDGPVAVQIKLKDGTALMARAWISACMPAFAPDSTPIRTVADELEQLLLGPGVESSPSLRAEAAEIVRRAFETVRLMNTEVMNGNIVDGRVNIAHTLGTQDSNDFGRNYAPIMASSIVDNLAVRALHARVYAALLSGTAPWFASVLRRPEEVADLSDKGRRKMPPMLRGADSRSLALTRRQIDKIVKAAQ